MRLDENSITSAFIGFVLGGLVEKRLSIYDPDIFYMYLMAGMLMIYGLITEKKSPQDGALFMLSVFAGVQIANKYIAYNASLKIGLGHP